MCRQGQAYKITAEFAPMHAQKKMCHIDGFRSIVLSGKGYPFLRTTFVHHSVRKRDEALKIFFLGGGGGEIFRRKGRVCNLTAATLPLNPPMCNE